MNTLRVPFKKTQRGATLVIALLLMVMIAAYGIPAAMNSMQNERMTGNTRQRELAFQAAEHALKDAEAFINTQTVEDLNGSFGLNEDGSCSDPDSGFLCDGEDHSNDAAYWRDDGTTNTFDWDANSNYRTATGTLSEVAQQPRYVIERMPSVCRNPAAPSSPPAPPPCSAPSVENHYYRITARGVGQDSNAIVILQTMYAFEPSPPSPPSP